MIYDVICESHLAIFYPLPYFSLEVINKVFAKSIENVPNISKYQDLTLSWKTL